MIITKHGKKKRLLLSTAILLVAFLLLCLWEAPPDSTYAVDKTTTNQSDVQSRREAFKKILSRVPVNNYQTSLEMKENVDFLLTSALLMQEVISDDIVITYPSE